MKRVGTLKQRNSLPGRRPPFPKTVAFDSLDSSTPTIPTTYPPGVKCTRQMLSRKCTSIRSRACSHLPCLQRLLSMLYAVTVECARQCRATCLPLSRHSATCPWVVWLRWPVRQPIDKAIDCACGRDRRRKDKTGHEIIVAGEMSPTCGSSPYSKALSFSELCTHTANLRLNHEEFCAFSLFRVD